MSVLQLNFDHSTTILKLTDWSLFGLETINTKGLQLGIEDFPNGKGLFFSCWNFLFLLSTKAALFHIQKTTPRLLLFLEWNDILRNYRFPIVTGICLAFLHNFIRVDKKLTFIRGLFLP
jgi:hypothetical protein